MANRIYLEQKDLQLLFDTGALKAASVLVAAMTTKTYHLILESNKNDVGLEGSYIMKSQRDDGAKQFSSIDAAVSAARKIGFKTVTVSFLG